MANLSGAAIFEGLLVVIGPELEIVEPAVLGEIAERTIGSTPGSSSSAGGWRDGSWA